MQINDAGHQIQSLSVDNAIRRLSAICSAMTAIFFPSTEDIHAGKNPLLTHIYYIFFLNKTDPIYVSSLTRLSDT